MTAREGTTIRVSGLVADHIMSSYIINKRNK